MQGNPPRQEIFVIHQVTLSTKHTSLTNYPVTCEDSDIPGNFSNQLIISVSPLEMSMFGGKVYFIKILRHTFFRQIFNLYEKCK